MDKRLFFICLFLAIFFQNNSYAQNDSAHEDVILDYKNPSKYYLAGIEVTGNETINKNIIIAFTGLKIGQTISVPGDEISKAINNIWKQKLFADVKIKVDKVSGKNIFLLIELKTRPRLSKFKINGVSKGEANKIRDEISLVRGDIVTQQLIRTVKNRILNYYADKGFLKAEVDINESNDTLFSYNSTTLTINIEKGKKVKIKEIEFTGNTEYKDSKLRKAMKDTKQKSILNIFKPSKFIKDKYEDDKDKVIAFYNSKGYRDAEITFDSVYYIDDYRLKIKIGIHRGIKYYFRNITFAGNTKYKSSTLEKILDIKKGDIYNPELLQRKLYFNPTGLDISSLYMDNGYLFFNVDPVETNIEGDSIDLEIRISEGPQATINKVTVTGNTKTSDHVILRELRTKPGDKFSRSDVIRTQRELSQLGYFDPEQTEVIPKPDPVTGTVDLEYKVVERPSDQLELQGGWAGNTVIGSLGFSFTNFSTRKLFSKPSTWGGPLPTGDGQRLTIRGQTNGSYFSSLNFSFTEPWFGGKKPNSLTVSSYYSIRTNGVKRGEDNRQKLELLGVTLGLGKRLKFPDDWFTLYQAISFEQYRLTNYQGLLPSFTDGNSNTISYQFTFSRNSIDQPIYPRNGSNFSFTGQATLPIATIKGITNDIDYKNVEPSKKYEWIEYHKEKFSAEWYLNAINKLVIATKAEFGFLGYYNSDIGLPPFERFYIGGDGISGFYIDGRELIKLRGYPNERVITPPSGGNIYNKYTMEIRYPLTLNPSATVYVLGFVEGGNSVIGFRNFDPFDVYRSAGFGARVFLPMFGLLGFDWGYRFDKYSPNVPLGGEFHIVIGQQF